MSLAERSAALRRFLSLALLLVVAACASAPRPQTAGPTPRSGEERRDYPVKIGQPYQVGGNWFYPADERNYDEVGIASWYGPGFNGKSTANGEVYDQEMLSAAHKTLPLPSYVEVTNLENGRSVVVRVNDRGPFVTSRIIDLSKRTAEILDVHRPGKAQVRVRRIYPSEPVMAALRRGVSSPTLLAQASAAPTPPLPAVSYAQNAAPRPAAPTPAPRPTLPASSPAPASAAAGAIGTVALPPSTATGGATPPAPFQPARPVAPGMAGSSFIQVAALGDRGRAEWLKSYLASYGAVGIEPSGTGLFRVRIGPYADAGAATEALAKVRAAGYQDAHIVSATATGGSLGGAF